MKFFVKNADQRTLILIDEFGAGTEPHVGGAIAESMLQRFDEVGAFGVITTHYTNLKHFAAGKNGIVNGAMLFDVGRIEPLFKLEIGKPGSSFAFEIARKIGLPEDLLKLAEDKAGKDYMSFEKHLRDISRDKRYWEKKRDSIRLANKKSEDYEKKLEEEWESIKSQRKEILKRAKDEAESILSQSNKLIENTIREIKESSADKERTLKVRKEVEGFKSELKQNEFEEDVILTNKMEQIRERQKRNEQRRIKRGEAKVSQEPKVELPKPLDKGEKVKIKGQDAVGEIMEVSEKNAVVAFGSMMTTIKLEKLERITLAEFRKTERTVRSPQTGVGFDLNKKRLNFRSDIDIRGYRTDEALQTVQDLVDEAAMIGIGRVRILHGKGNGILRQEIRNYLKTIPYVKNFNDEHVEFGGAGITIVEIDT